MWIIDPMHNLLLGTSKKCNWKSNNVLTEKYFVEVQGGVDDVGCLPSKIPHFSGFTAEQLKNWTIYFSSYALKGILLCNHYNCWLLDLCRRSISVSELEEGDKHFVMHMKPFLGPLCLP